MSHSLDPESGEIMTDADLEVVLERLSLHKRKNEKLTKSVIEYFERISIHNEKPIYWGYNAVDTLIKEGRGAHCFKPLENFPPAPAGY